MWQLHGKTIIPGLIEAHTHAAFDADMLCLSRERDHDDPLCRALNQTDVETTLRRIDAGEIIGPRILSLGPMIDEPPARLSRMERRGSNAARRRLAVAERLILKHDVDGLIVTQRVTAPNHEERSIDVAHAHQRRVIGQIWAVDGEEAAKLGIDELHTSSRVYRRQALSGGAAARATEHCGSTGA